MQNAVENPIINEQDLEELLNLNYSAAELQEIEKFLYRFCTTGRTYLTRIFVRGKVKKKPLPEIMQVCKVAWESTWQYGTPERFGDSDDTAPPDVGLRNTVAFYGVYQTLGLPRPKFLF